MAQPYPKTFPKGEPRPLWEPPSPANDNRPGRGRPWGLPANDNRPQYPRSPKGPPRPKGPWSSLGRGFSTWAIQNTLLDAITKPVMTDEPGGLPSTQPGWTLDAGMCRANPGAFMAQGSTYCGAQVEPAGAVPWFDGVIWQMREFTGPYIDPLGFPDYWLFHRTWQHAGVAGTVPDYQQGRLPQVDPVWVQAGYFAPFGLPLVNPFPRSTPWRFATLNPEAFYDVVPKPLAPPSPVFPKPPGKHVKETKHMVAITGGFAYVVGMLTESMDALNAIYQALPGDLRRRLKREHSGYMGPWEKAQALYAHLSDVDIGKAMGNLAAEWAEDKFFGKLGEFTRRANQIRGMPGGLELGPALGGGPTFSWNISK